MPSANFGSLGSLASFDSGLCPLYGFSVPGAGSAPVFPGNSDLSFFSPCCLSCFGWFEYDCACWIAIREESNGEWFDGRREDRAADWSEDLDILARVLDCRNIENMLALTDRGRSYGSEFPGSYFQRPLSASHRNRGRNEWVCRCSVHWRQIFKRS